MEILLLKKEDVLKSQHMNQLKATNKINNQIEYTDGTDLKNIEKNGI